MMSATEVIAAVQSNGGSLTLTSDGGLSCETQPEFLPELRLHRDEIVEILKRESRTVEILVCFCKAYRCGHIHNESSRRKAITEWNQQSKHKIEVRK